MNTNLSIDPANNDTLEGAFRHILNKLNQTTDSMLPAKVISYDRKSNKATVQPLIKVVSTDNSTLSRAEINNIPVLLLGGGGYLISFPINPGDLGWIIASDRDISVFTQNFDDSIPNTFRSKDFADSVFIPDAMTGYTINPGDSINLTIQSLDGDVKITLGGNTLTLKAENIVIDPTDLTINATNMTINATTLTIDATNVNIDGIVNITGSLFVNGNPIT